MKHRLLIFVLLLSTTAAFADGPAKRTVVIRDGRVVSNVVNGVEVIDARDLRDGEFFFGRRAHLGVRLTDLSSELREHYGAPKDAGVLVASVENDSPADKAGVKVGDIVVSVDGNEISSHGEFRRLMLDKKAGDSLRLEVLRNRSRQTLVATVSELRGNQLVIPRDIPGVREFSGPEWRARIESIGDCAALQSRIKELESRLKDLEKKLQK